MSLATSVWEKNDLSFLRWAIPFYLRREPVLVIDPTWGSGSWWDDSPWLVIGFDLVKPAPIKASYECWPFRDGIADVVVADPPHRSSGGPRSSGLLTDRYGSVGTRPDALLSVLPLLVGEANRVLKPGGILLLKLADQVHWHRSVWHHVAAVQAGQDCGLTVCDLIVKVRRNAIRSSMWQNQYHALKRHCFWVVFRRGGCEP